MFWFLPVVILFGGEMGVAVTVLFCLGYLLSGSLLGVLYVLLLNFTVRAFTLFAVVWDIKNNDCTWIYALTVWACVGLFSNVLLYHSLCSIIYWLDLEEYRTGYPVFCLPVDAPYEFESSVDVDLYREVEFW